MTKLQEYLRSKSFLLTMILSHVVIVVFSLLVIGLIYKEAEGTLESELERGNSVLLDQIRLAMDRQMEDIERISLQIAFNQRIRSLLTVKGPRSENQSYSMIQILNDFRLYGLANRFFYDFYVYFNQSGTAVASDTIYESPQLLHQLVHGRHELSFERWKKLMSEKHFKTYELVRSTPPAAPEARSPSVASVLFMRTLPIEGDGQPLATIVFCIDGRSIWETVRGLQWFSEGQVYILDSQNRLVASTSAEEERLPKILAGLEGRSSRSLSMGAESLLVSQTRSSVTDWKYVTAVPTRTFLQRMNSLRNVVTIILIGWIVLGPLAAILLSLRSYNPIKGLISAFESVSGVSFKTTRASEFNYIKDALDSAFRKKGREEQSALADAALVNLLRGRIDRRVGVKELRELYGLDLASGRFAVALVRVEAQTPARRERGEGSILAALRDFSAGGQAFSLHAAAIDELVACLVSFPEAADAAAAASAIQERLERSIRVPTTVSVSSVQFGPARVSTAYKEAVAAMDYKLVMSSRRVISFDDTRLCERRYNYKLETEHTLINAIKAGDREKSGRIVDSVFEANTGEAVLSVQLARCLIFDLSSTIIKVKEELGPIWDACFKANWDPIERLLESESLDDVHATLLEISSALCGYIERNKKSHNRQLAQRVREFVLENLGDFNLGTKTVSDRFDSNPHYLARLFKEQTGEYLTDFINRRRIEAAKAMLHESRREVKEVALAAGYANCGTFIRLFRKYEGVTPGQYKDRRWMNEESGA